MSSNEQESAAVRVEQVAEETTVTVWIWLSSVDGGTAHPSCWSTREQAMQYRPKPYGGTQLDRALFKVSLPIDSLRRVAPVAPEATS